MLKQFIGRLIPRQIIYSFRNYRILSSNYGQYRTIKNWESVDSNGEPIPWYTYPATEFIQQLDLTQKTLFEFGSGNSTRYFAKHCKSVVAIEDDRDWYEKVKPTLPANVDYRFIEDPSQYASAITNYPNKFDVISVDGSHRNACAKQSVERLSDDGFMILDNSDWHTETTRFLRQADLIEIDMAGFGPINGYTSTTSFFLRRGVSLPSGSTRQPLPSAGALLHNVDADLSEMSSRDRA